MTGAENHLLSNWKLRHMLDVNICACSLLSTPSEFVLASQANQSKNPRITGVFTLVNLKGTHSEIFYCELEELANQLTAQENHNV